MAKHDDRRVRDTIARENETASKDLDSLRSEMIVPTTQNMYNNYNRSADQAFGDYGNIMGEYDNFSKTGGYNALDKSNMRNRALSPIRSIYANANREVDRSKSLQGGYSPGYGVLKARMARDMNQGMSDAAGGTEAQLAQMINEGKRFGTAGKQSLFGQTPGMASTFGNQLLGSTSNWLQAQGLRNQLSLGTMQAQQASASLPGNWDHTMSRIGQIANIGKNLASIPGMPKVGGSPGGTPGDVANPGNNPPPSGSGFIPASQSINGFTPSSFNNSVPNIPYGSNVGGGYGGYGGYGGGTDQSSYIPSYGGTGSFYNNPMPSAPAGGSNNMGTVNNYDWNW